MNKDVRNIINSINSNDWRIRDAMEKLEKINKSKTDSIKMMLDKKPGANTNDMYDYHNIHVQGEFAKMIISIIKQDCIDVIERCEEENINLLKQLKQLEIE